MPLATRNIHSRIQLLHEHSQQQFRQLSGDSSTGFLCKVMTEKLINFVVLARGALPRNTKQETHFQTPAAAEEVT